MFSKKNRKLFALLLVFSAIISVIGCGGITYKGKFVTVAVPYEPREEFEHEGWIVLTFEKPGMRTEEGEVFRFWLCRDGKKQRELVLNAKIVGTRKFYLQEKVGDNTIAHASFVAPPSYEAVVERVKALISSETAH